MEIYIPSTCDGNTRFSDVVGGFMNASTHNMDFRYTMHPLIPPPPPPPQLNAQYVTAHNQLMGKTNVTEVVSCTSTATVECNESPNIELLNNEQSNIEPSIQFECKETSAVSEETSTEINLPCNEEKLKTKSIENIEKTRVKTEEDLDVTVTDSDEVTDDPATIRIDALNDQLESKKGAVKRKARPPRQSVDAKSNKRSKIKNKTKLKNIVKIVKSKESTISKTVSTLIDPNRSQGSISNGDVTEEERLTPTKTTSKSTVKIKNKKSTKPIKPPNLKCMVCDKELSTEQNLMKHLLTHNNNHTCLKCMKTFKSTHFLKHHMDKHNESYNYSCPICNKKFKFRNNMRGHMRKHNMEKKFECTICQKKFIGKYNLKEHMKAHSDNRPFNCDFCKKAYKDKGALNKHLLTHQERKVECTVCQRPFTNQSQVDRHMQFHYSWPGDSFQRKSNVDSNGEKLKYKCEHCDKSFNHYSNMNAHLHKKHKERKIQCRECPKSFAYQYELREHMFIHLGGQSSKFKCQVCDKSFQRSTTLKNHERTTHLGIKRFKCEICSKLFGTKFNMKVHVDKLHNENNVNTTECKPKRVRQRAERIVTRPEDLVAQLPPPPCPPQHHFPQLPVTMQPPHQHPLLRNFTTSDIIRNAMQHIPELGYFPTLQPHPTRGYQFFGIPPPSDFGVS